jgi:2-oxoglutarate ferredoxin oxidoreductase subunit beta
MLPALMAGLRRAFERDGWPLSVFYVSPDKPTFEDNTGVYREDPRPLYQRDVDLARLRDLVQSFEAGT